MTLIKSISGIRGTIGGHVGEGLNPLDIVKFTSAYATLIRKTTPFSMFYMTFLAILTLLGNLISDILYAVVDPRVRIA